MTEKSIPKLSSAFILGRIIEEYCSINRKKIALKNLHDENHPLKDERIISKSSDEIELTSLSISEHYEPLRPYLPKRLVSFLQRLEENRDSGLGKMDSDQLSLLHSAISGIIEESMTRGTVWRSLQAGRLSQRVLLLQKTILHGMVDHKMPNEVLLKYITFRSESPYIDFEGGTHLWIMHQVFANLLREKLNPRSAESTLIRLGHHIESLPVPEALKKDYEKMRMAENRILNDLSFIDVHDMIGDDPIDNYDGICTFFERQKVEITAMIETIRSYCELFEKFLEELGQDELFHFDP